MSFSVGNWLTIYVLLLVRVIRKTSTQKLVYRCSRQYHSQPKSPSKEETAQKGEKKGKGGNSPSIGEQTVCSVHTVEY